MAQHLEAMVRSQLVDRRERLQSAIPRSGAPEDLTRLLAEVDAALGRMDNHTYGLCEVCHDPIETDRLMADPLLRLCIDHLTPTEQRALEEDLALASHVQAGLLPRQDAVINGWQISYHYQAARVVSGDYCDLVAGPEGSLHFLIGDVSGKGVAASMLMTHLHALFRTLIAADLPLGKMVERASRVFCESTLPSYFATLICGRASASGQVEICNAGHVPALVLSRGEITEVSGTGIPLGIFCDGKFTTREARLEAGDSLLLYTDGFSEARNAAGDEYGIPRLKEMAASLRGLSSREKIQRLVSDLERFRDGGAIHDDISMMAVQKI